MNKPIRLDKFKTRQARAAHAVGLIWLALVGSLLAAAVFGH